MENKKKLSFKEKVNIGLDQIDEDRRRVLDLGYATLGTYLFRLAGIVAIFILLIKDKLSVESPEALTAFFYILSLCMLLAIIIKTVFLIFPKQYKYDFGALSDTVKLMFYILSSYLSAFLGAYIIGDKESYMGTIMNLVSVSSILFEIVLVSIVARLALLIYFMFRKRK